MRPVDDSKLGDKLDMLDYLAEKRNALLKEKHKCLRSEVLQLKDLFSQMKTQVSSPDFGNLAKSLKETEDRLVRNSFADTDPEPEPEPEPAYDSYDSSQDSKATPPTCDSSLGSKGTYDSTRQSKATIQISYDSPRQSKAALQAYDSPRQSKATLQAYDSPWHGKAMAPQTKGEGAKAGR